MHNALCIAFVHNALHHFRISSLIFLNLSLNGRTDRLACSGVVRLVPPLLVVEVDCLLSTLHTAFQ